MNNFPKFTILLTGAIDIKGTPFAKSVPKNIRLNEYIKSITYMLKKHRNLNFVYVDSSNYDLKLESQGSYIHSKGHVICNKLANKKRWKKVRYPFISENELLTLDIGGVGKFTKGKRYYADIKLEYYYPEFNYYKFHNK